jgi:diadenosine tetraphosphate (Ap4A) HIT family hydrolase
MAWSETIAWTHVLAGVDCVMCADIHLDVSAFSFLAAELRQSHFRFGRNQYPRGYSVVPLKRHADELFDLSDDELAAAWRDIADAGASIQRVFAAVKINYAILGNSCPHIHCHVLPQFTVDDTPRPLDGRWRGSPN